MIILQCPRNDFQSVQDLLRKLTPMLPHILRGWFLQRLKALQMKRVILWGP